jgi:hypothetical protein
VRHQSTLLEGSLIKAAGGDSPGERHVFQVLGLVFAAVTALLTPYVALRDPAHRRTRPSGAQRSRC